MSTTPNTIPFTSVVFGDRARTTYDNIDLLAESIRQIGLLCPIILSPLPDGKFLLEDGGRRYRALESLGVTELHHAATGDPQRPGFITKSEQSSGETAKLTELIANLHRENLDWREEVGLLVEAFRLKKREFALAGEQLYYSTFGKLVGNYNYSDINAAICIYDELKTNPQRFASCTTLHVAYAQLLRETQEAAQAELAKRALAPAPVAPPTVDHTGSVVETYVPPVTFPLSSRFRLGNSLDWMERERPMFDHIICDPDFAVSKERLEAGVSGASAGVAQDDVQQSLADLQRLIQLASICCNNYFIFFYDLDHHEKLQNECTKWGFRVQRWPILWHKTDYRSNAAPQHNFTKNMEYAMVCRQPSATLATAAPSGVISLPSANTVDTFNHPFAKPLDLWKRIYAAVTSPGQTTFDPFMGSGTAVVAALQSGLVPSGMELQPTHFNNAVLQIKRAQTVLQPNTMFT